MTTPALISDQSPAPQLLWKPEDHAPQDTRLAEFAAFIGARTGRDFSGYDQAAFQRILEFSVNEAESFWDALWDFAGVVGEKGPEIIKKIDQVPYARFFPGGKISYAENSLLRAMENPGSPAIIARTQDGPDRVLSGQDLYDQVSLWEQALRGAGIKEGDAIGVYLPNIPETVILLLAASQIGAVFCSAGMEMGPADLINRFGQIRPKLLVTCAGYTHWAKKIDRREVAESAQKEISSIDRVVWLEEAEAFLGELKPQKIDFIRRDFNHPLYILFSSGSTGKPKCFEHSSGGTLLKHICEYQLHCDVRPGDHVFYHATPSWMMWNWLAGGLSNRAAILMYDGSPAYPDAYAQWDFTTAHGCTHHGTAAPVILSWAQGGLDIAGRYKTPGGPGPLGPLRAVMSTGAVLPAQGFTYIHEKIKSDVKIGSISGGTDIVGCFVGGNAYTPTYAGQINGPILGMNVQVWNDEAKPVGPGETGELVCLNAFPSMPLRFIGESGEERYYNEYFSYYTDQKVWHHGDAIEKTLQGQLKIIGRSDATLNQNGVRIGTIAIYDQLEPFADEFTDSAAVDFTRSDNQQAITILFLAIDAPEVPDELQAKIKKAVKDNITPYAIPTEIIAVPGILKTPNGKKAEVVMKKILAGKDVPNASLYGEDLVERFKGIGEALREKYS